MRITSNQQVDFFILAQNDDPVNSPPPTNTIQKIPSESTTPDQASTQQASPAVATGVAIVSYSRYTQQPLLPIYYCLK